MPSLDIQVGSVVTIGLGTMNTEVQAWITFPDLGATHEVNPSSSPSCQQYEEVKSSVRHFEKIFLPCVHNPKHLKGTVLEIREDCWGTEQVLIDLGNRQRWFPPHLLNCPPLTIPG